MKLHESRCWYCRSTATIDIAEGRFSNLGLRQGNDVVFSILINPTATPITLILKKDSSNSISMSPLLKIAGRVLC